MLWTVLLHMSLVRLLLAALLAASGLVAALATPASACSCAGLGPRALVEGADTVFVGVLEDAERSGQTATYGFAVVEVLEGETGRTAEIHSASSGASCGLEFMDVGTTYLVVASGGRAGLCGGTREADPSYVARVEALTGPARPPAGDGPAELAPGRDDGDRDVLVVAAVAGAGLLVVVAAAVLLARRVTRRVTGRVPAGRSRPSGSPPRS